jgi:hypothetical protein
MKKLLLAFMVLTLFACSSEDNQDKPLFECDNVFEGDIQLSSQAEVDAFAANGYCEVKGRLQIGSDDAESDITNVDALASLKGILGSLEITNNPNLTNLNGLRNLVLVGAGISISKNDALINLEGLNSLTTVPTLGIADMASLTTLQGLENVSNIVGLYIYDNPELLTIDALKNVSVFKDADVGLDITIGSCPGITSLPDFKNITKAESVHITDNAALTSLEGLHHIKSVVHDLVVSGNPQLGSLQGIRGITGFEVVNIDNFFNTLTIKDNVMLTSLNGFENIQSFHGYLTVSGNYMLTDFCAISHMMTTEEGFDIGYGVYNNHFNPDWDDFQAGNCSQ